MSEGQVQLDKLIKQWLGYGITTTTLAQININFRNGFGADRLNKKQFFKKLDALIDSAPVGLEIKVDRVSNQMIVSLKNTSNYKMSDMFYFEFDQADVFMKLKVVESITDLIGH